MTYSCFSFLPSSFFSSASYLFCVVRAEACSRPKFAACSNSLERIQSIHNSWSWLLFVQCSKGECKGVTVWTRRLYYTHSNRMVVPMTSTLEITTPSSRWVVLLSKILLVVIILFLLPELVRAKPKKKNRA
jgi:hypothetical protein